MSDYLTRPAEIMVHCRSDGNVSVITISNPPVNAISQHVRKGLVDAIAAAQSDAGIAAILIVGDGANFIAGADIREFGKPPIAPTLPDVCTAIESSAKPVLAALHGASLGGGLETALASHYRIAAASARLGFPEVLLGLIPGSGGTQRATRLAGVKAALDLMLSGRQIGAAEAMKTGLVDKVVPDDELSAAALAWAHELADTKAAPRRTRDATAGLGDVDAGRAAIGAARKEAASKSRGLFAPFKLIDAVEAALDRPFDEAMAVERANFLAAVDSPQRAGLVHAFFAEREVAKAPETRANLPRAFASVAVIGGGTMGAGIAVSVLDAGLPVMMIERDEPSLQRGRGFVEKVYDGLISKGRMDAAAKDRLMASFSGATSYDALSSVDLVIEAVFEDMAVKKQVFAELDRVCRPGAVLATNTSYLDIDEIAGSVSRPQDVLGLHFFSPANIMKLLEIVVPAKVSPDVVATGFALAKKLKKVAVRAGVCDGFIGNRILGVYKLVADYMMEDGASPYDIDSALREFGFAMGPYQVTDLAGGDISWAGRKRRAATRDPKQRYVRIADRICENGWFGQKTGRGFYLYEKGSRSGTPDPEVLKIVDDERARAGLTPRSFGNDEIVRRVIAAMANEGAKIVDEKIALRPLDVDVVFISGYGFPRYRGGPMKVADTIGLPQLLADIRRFELEDPVFWKASPLLVRLVEEGRDFESLNHA